MRSKTIVVLWMLCAWVLAACGTPAAAPTPALESGASAHTTSATALPAPQYREAAQRITTQNVNQIQYLGRLESPQGATSSFFQHTFSPDGTRLAALNNDFLMTWDLITGMRLTNTSRRTVTRLEYSPDKTEIYALTAEGYVLVFDEAGTEKTDFLALETFNGLSDYHAEAGWLALGGTDGTVRVWNPAERTSMVTIQAAESAIDRLFFSDDGTKLATIDQDYIIKIWDWQQRTPIQELWFGGEPFIRATFSPDAAQLAAVTPEGLLLWDIASGERQYNIQLQPNGGDSILQYSPNGGLLVTAGGSADMVLWSPQNGSVVWRIPEASGSRVSVAFSPDSTLMITSVFEREVTLWNLTELTEDSIPRSTLPVESVRVTDVSFSPDGFTLALFEAAGTIFVWGIPPES